MAIYKLVLPKMGESVSEATITKWVKSVGDHIEEDDTVAEVATDKVDSEVPSPVSGKLSKILFEPNQVAQVGDIIAWIEVEGNDEQDVPLVNEDTERSGSKEIDHSADEDEESVLLTEESLNLTEDDFTTQEDRNDVNMVIPGTELLPQESETSATPSNGLRFYSPLVRNIAQQENLTQAELDSINGSGSEGRVTKQDILDFLERRSGSVVTSDSKISKEQQSAAVEPTQIPSPEVISSPDSTRATTINSSGDEIVEMDRMRKLIADHMVHSVKTSPHVASFVEADVTNIVNWRNKWKDSYKNREGENITFTPIFIEAICKALKDFPMVNVSIDGHNIIKKKDINIGMAAALPTGNLIVPVIRNADQLSLVGLSKSVNDLANRSRQNKLKPDDTQGGTFTFTNIGAFGNIMGVPIINQPQAAILAVGTIKKRPAVLETEYGDVIAIRHMMYLSMSYDHRIIDGALGGTFLKRVADYLENWDINRVI